MVQFHMLEIPLIYQIFQPQTPPNTESITEHMQTLDFYIKDGLLPAFLGKQFPVYKVYLKFTETGA